MKRFFAIIISICMLFCFMPTTAFADDIGGSTAGEEPEVSYFWDSECTESATDENGEITWNFARCNEIGELVFYAKADRKIEIDYIEEIKGDKIISDVRFTSVNDRELYKLRVPNYGNEGHGVKFKLKFKHEDVIVAEVSINCIDSEVQFYTLYTNDEGELVEDIRFNGMMLSETMPTEEMPSILIKGAKPSYTYKVFQYEGKFEGDFDCIEEGVGEGKLFNIYKQGEATILQLTKFPDCYNGFVFSVFDEDENCCATVKFYIQSQIGVYTGDDMEHIGDVFYTGKIYSVRYFYENKLFIRYDEKGSKERLEALTLKAYKGTISGGDFEQSGDEDIFGSLFETKIVSAQDSEGNNLIGRQILRKENPEKDETGDMKIVVSENGETVAYIYVCGQYHWDEPEWEEPENEDPEDEEPEDDEPEWEEYENPIRIISDNAEDNNPNEAHFNVSQPLDSDVNTVKLAFPKEFEEISIVKITEDGLYGDDRTPKSEVVMDLRDDKKDNDLNDIFGLSKVESGAEENTVNLNLLKIPNHARHYITFKLKTEGGHVQECEISTCVDIDISIKAASGVPEYILNEVSVKLHFTEFSDAIKKAYDEGVYAEKKLFGDRLKQENEDEQLYFTKENGIRTATQKALSDLSSDIQIGGSVYLSTIVPDGYVIEKITDPDNNSLLWQAEIESLFLLKNPAGERLSNLETYKFIDKRYKGNNSTSVSFDRERMEVIQNSELYKYMKGKHEHNEVSEIPFSMPAASQGIAYNLPEDMKGEKYSDNETYEEYFKGFYKENITELINACGNEYETELRHSATVYSINVPTNKMTGVVIHIKKLEDEKAETITASGNDKVQLKHEEVVNNETAKNIALDSFYAEDTEVINSFKLENENEVGNQFGDFVDIFVPYSKIGNGELTKDKAKENKITIVWFKNDNTPVPMIADYLENGISFRTGHFSEYAVVGDPSVKKKDDAPSGNNGSTSGTGNTGGISVPVIAPPVDNIETVKTEATTKIEEAIKAVDTKNYTEEEKKAIEDIKAAAEKAIKEAKTEDEVKKALENAQTEVKKAETNVTIAHATADFEIKAVTKRLKSGKIKVTVKFNGGKAGIEELKAKGYKISYKFFRSTKKNGKYTEKLAKDAPNYINSKGTKGKKYYYKVALVIEDPNGLVVYETSLTDCKSGASIFKKKI